MLQERLDILGTLSDVLVLLRLSRRRVRVRRFLKHSVLRRR